MVGGTKASSHSPVWVFVEGGGSTRMDQAPIRKGFADLFAKILGTRSKPTVIACGGRGHAFQEWARARRTHPHTLCLLLVDSETPVQEGLGPWDHVRRRQGDGWEKPPSATDDHLHFMVQAMEAWLVADQEALVQFYGNALQTNALPVRRDIENIPKQQLNQALEHASRNTKKGAYDKSHGFVLIGLIDPAKIRAVSPYAARVFDHLVAVCPPRER